MNQPKPAMLRTVLTAALIGCIPRAAAAVPAPTAPYDVSNWEQILSTYATQDGGFRYGALHSSTEHRAALEAFVAAIASAKPDAWSRDDQLAFYINAYNALTVRAVLALWPLESVMSVKGFFNARKHRVAGQSVTLDHLENAIIRGSKFSEPRIHFLVSCASAGCPRLVGYAITAGNLEQALQRQALEYVRKSTQVDRANGLVRVSKIFEWFAKDFDEGGGVRRFVAQRLRGADAAFAMKESTKIAFFDYDWTLNERL